MFNDLVSQRRGWLSIPPLYPWLWLAPDETDRAEWYYYI